MHFFEQACKLAQDSVRKLDIKQKAFYDKRTKSRKFDVEDNVLLLLPNESNKLLLQWDGPYEVVEVVNVMYYKMFGSNLRLLLYGDVPVFW